MKERPILFSGEMVRAILAGRKTQTRRVVKPQPTMDNNWSGGVQIRSKRIGIGIKPFNEQRGKMLVGDPTPCPYGQPGDRLWVRESFQPLLADGFDICSADYETGKGYKINYVASDGIVEFLDTADERIKDRVIPSIHMPRWASRITLEIVSVRVERVQDISEEDAIAEGTQAVSIADVPRQAAYTERQDFSRLWDSINAKRGYSWEANPWVWVIEFK